MPCQRPYRYLIAAPRRSLPMLIIRRAIKIVGWTAVAGLSLLPINVALAFAYKFLYDVPFVAEDAMGIAAALFGIVAATNIYRIFLSK